MPLRALAVCCQPQLLEKVVPVFELAEIKTEVCVEAADAWQKLQRAKYDAAVVDCEQAPGWPEAMASVRRSGPNRACVLFAILDRVAKFRDAHGAGASFALERNFPHSSLLRSLRAVYGLMLAERQRYYRHPIEAEVSLAYVSAQPREPFVVTSYNISQGGMAVRSPLLLARDKVELQFHIPSSHLISSEGEVVWTRSSRAGIRFTRMSQRSREELVQWLREEWGRTQPPPAQIPLTLPSARAATSGRRLRCHAFITQLPVGWKCTGCGWQHFIRIEATSWRYANHPPESVVHAFDTHLCSEHPAEPGGGVAHPGPYPPPPNLRG